MFYSLQNTVVNETFAYDDLGHLTTFVTDMDGMTGASYVYDVFGRLVAKNEADSSIAYDYVNGSYRPVSVSVNGTEIPRAQEHDASGNVWLDGHSKSAYTVNALGLPDRVRMLSGNLAEITLAQVDGSSLLEGESGHIDMGYDEDGLRVWTHAKSAGMDYATVTVPGFGEYYAQYITGEGQFSLNRIDLVGGGFRAGVSGNALFPITDAQGNIRGYAGRNGLHSKYAYYPFGSVIEIANDGAASSDRRRWQSKEFEGEHGKYYFGARYFDPFLGLWTSPDPANQFANPYTYGGDPVNYVDPLGLWSIGAVVVVGWDKEHGWHVGLGAAMDFSNEGTLPGFDFSYTWNQDGSNSVNAGVNMTLWGGGANFNFGIAYNYNSYSGSVISTHAGVCFGAAGIACAGIDYGYAASWDASGNFMGLSVYAQAYADAAGGLAHVSSGYEAGLFGTESRGLYAGGNLGGLYAEASRLERGYDFENIDYGFEHRFDIGGYNPEKGWYFSNTAKTVGGLFALDVNQSIWAMSWQLLSRFTWEAIQTTAGLVTGIVASEIGLVDNVEYERGATILRYNPKHPIMRLFKDRAFTLGSFIAGHRDRLTREGEDILSHEYGHTLQSRLFGPGYIAVMFLSPISAAGKTNKEHMKTFIERDATERSKRYGF